MILVNLANDPAPDQMILTNLATEEFTDLKNTVPMSPEPQTSSAMTYGLTQAIQNSSQ